MKNIEKLAVFLIVAWVLQAVSTPAVIISMRNIALSEHLDVISRSLGFLSGVGHFLIALVCGVWLFLQGEKERQSKWVWCLFGLLFQLQAIAIFYLYVILQDMRGNKIANQASQTIVAEAAPQSER
jgi:hypothetical protein